MNETLLLMNRKGFTDYANDFIKGEEFKKRISQGAKYLIVNDSTILKNAVIQPFIVKPIGPHKNISIFDLWEIK